MSLHIPLTDLSNAFNLSESFGPTHNGLSVHKTLSNPNGGRFVVLKSTKMKMYPVSSYGKKEVTYLVYSTKYAPEFTTMFEYRFATLKDLNIFIKSLK
jgi:hypothetical protein